MERARVSQPLQLLPGLLQGSERVGTDTWEHLPLLRRCWEGDTCPQGIRLVQSLGPCPRWLTVLSGMAGCLGSVLLLLLLLLGEPLSSC